MSLKYIDNNGQEVIIAGHGKDGEVVHVGTVVGYTGSADNIPEGYEIAQDVSFGGGMPIGSGCDYYGTTPPEDFLFADGSAISRTTYAKLFAIIGTTYGAGDGSTTFNLPDKRERVSVMYKSGSTNYGTLGGKLGSSNCTLTTANLPAHSHSYTEYYINTNWEPTTAHRRAYAGKKVYDAYTTSQTSKETGSLSTANTGSGTAFSVVQPTLVCNYIIKVK